MDSKDFENVFFLMKFVELKHSLIWDLDTIIDGEPVLLVDIFSRDVSSFAEAVMLYEAWRCMMKAHNYGGEPVSEIEDWDEEYDEEYDDEFDEEYDEHEDELEVYLYIRFDSNQDMEKFCEENFF